MIISFFLSLNVTGGDLVSIHSQEEAVLLNPFLRYTGFSIFVGLVRVKGNTSGKLIVYFFFFFHSNIDLY